MPDCLDEIRSHEGAYYAGGEWRASSTGETRSTENPATEETIVHTANASPSDVAEVVEIADNAFRGSWSAMAPSDRAGHLFKVADLIDERQESLAVLETLDMGKPLREARANIKRAADTFRYYAGAADKLAGESTPLGQGRHNFTRREPLGVTAHITPWNYPFANACRSAPPALAAGNTVVIKPASETPLTTLLLPSICEAAGIPPGVVNVITGSGSLLGPSLVEHPLVRGITFTGSVETGRDVAVRAAKGVKPAILELGGKNPLIVFEDADLDEVVKQVLRGAFTNAGQVCTAVSRLLVVPQVFDDLSARLVRAVETLTVGPGLEDHDLGPLVSAQHRASVEAAATLAVSQGATRLTGGSRPANFSVGHYFSPTVFTDVHQDSDLANNEVFGPVLAVLRVDDEAHALTVANSLDLGLCAGVFTQDLSRAMRMVEGLQAGMVWVNDWFASPVQVPHGGFKASGLGREQGMTGLQGYTQIKNVSMRYQSAYTEGVAR